MEPGGRDAASRNGRESSSVGRPDLEFDLSAVPRRAPLSLQTSVLKRHYRGADGETPMPARPCPVGDDGSRGSTHEASCSQSGAEGGTSGTVEHAVSTVEKVASVRSLEKAFISVCPMSSVPALRERRKPAGIGSIGDVT